ncbi:Rieske 2Fe-2S domain-containing protein [bacterium]|nr:Rieske 2Fe-2S domain-containing protein [bacterium]
MGGAKKFFEACAVDDVKLNQTHEVEVNGEDVLLVNDGGEIHGLSPYCTHDGENLDAEEVHDHQVECPRHGARFDVRSGEVTRMPAVYGIASYPIKVENGKVFVEVDE